jgi:hypothetical protein
MASTPVFSVAVRCIEVGRRVAIRAGVNQRMMPAAMLAVVVLLASRIEQLANVAGLPSSGRPIQQIAQQFPVAAVIKAQTALRFAGKLVKPREQRNAQRVARENPARILAELREHGRTNELAAARLIVIGTLALELTAIVRDETHTDQVAVDEVGKFSVHKYTHDVGL